MIIGSRSIAVSGATGVQVKAGEGSFSSSIKSPFLKEDSREWMISCMQQFLNRGAQMISRESQRPLTPILSKRIATHLPFLHPLLLLRNTLVTPAPHIQGKNMNKHLDKIYDPPKCFKTRQIRQFGGHIFVHFYFALYVGVGVARRIPNCDVFAEVLRSGVVWRPPRRSEGEVAHPFRRLGVPGRAQNTKCFQAVSLSRVHA